MALTEIQDQLYRGLLRLAILLSCPKELFSCELIADGGSKSALELQASGRQRILEYDPVLYTPLERSAAPIVSPSPATAYFRSFIEMQRRKTVHLIISRMDIKTMM